jgi:hypothetical protein
MLDMMQQTVGDSVVCTIKSSEVVFKVYKFMFHGSKAHNSRGLAAEVFTVQHGFQNIITET